MKNLITLEIKSDSIIKTFFLTVLGLLSWKKSAFELILRVLKFYYPKYHFLLKLKIEAD
jgi:hypothetical protein